MWARAKYYYRTGQQGQIDKFDKEDEKMKKKYWHLQQSNYCLTVRTLQVKKESSFSCF